MDSSLSFELCVLARMSDGYAASVLADIGLTEASARGISSRCPYHTPEQLVRKLEFYSRFLGPAVRSSPLGSNTPSVFAGSIAHDFVLGLWPHLYWRVNAAPDGRSWGVGFRNQTVLSFQRFDASIVRRGVWTLAALEQLADRHELHDGWDERLIVRFAFGADLYEGTFVFGLLQEWRRTSDVPNGDDPGDTNRV